MVGACVAGVHGGGGVHGRGACVAGKTAIAARSTHHTGMHSCFVIESLIIVVYKIRTYSGFSQKHNIGNNASIAIRGFTT